MLVGRQFSRAYAHGIKTSLRFYSRLPVIDIDKVKAEIKKSKPESNVTLTVASRLVEQLKAAAAQQDLNTNKESEVVEFNEKEAAQDIPKKERRFTAPVPIVELNADVSLRKVYLPEVNSPKNSMHANVAIMGAPNAGKSTFLNYLIGEKVSAVSSKSQTTRKQILGVWTSENVQITFCDTPGVATQTNENRLNRSICHASWNAIQETNHVFLIVNSPMSPNPMEERILEKIQEMEEPLPVTLILNKDDLFFGGGREKLQKIATYYMNKYLFIRKTITTSAIHRSNFHTIKNHLKSIAKPGPWMYHSSVKTPLSTIERVEDLLKEKIFKRYNSHIPYLVEPEITSWNEHPDDIIEIHATLHAKEEDFYKILIGKDGSAIEYIKYKTEVDVKNIFRKECHIHLRVRHSKSFLKK